MSEFLELLRICDDCPNQTTAQTLRAANEHLGELPIECVLLARKLIEEGNCTKPRVEIDLPADPDVVSIETHCDNQYLHDAYRVIRAGEIIRSLWHS